MSVIKLPPKPPKKSKRFGDVPTAPSETLAAPETAPMEPVEIERRVARRKTGRTIHFGTKVSEDFDARFRKAKYENRLKGAELLEQMMDAWEKRQKR